jgi:uncharacterized protein DUF6941
MPARPPYLIGAFFCEKVLVEQDNVMTPVRIVDRLFVPRVQEPDEKPEAFYGLSLFLGFKSGDYRGKATVHIVANAPDGETREGPKHEIEFPDQPSGGITIVQQMALAFRNEGVHWFDVYLNDELVTRMPLDVQVQRSGTKSSEKPA